jgi:uncharacterized protein (TIGR00296 family)
MLTATKDHCAICFDALNRHLRKETTIEYEETDQVPLFVTWKIQGRLRGCIGNLSSLSFPQGLVDYAIRAGVQDTRFDPISLSELPKLTCGVSLLVNFVPGKAWDDWDVGTHGIVLRFESRGESFKAVFLPEVASEQGWTKRETVDALAKKSGFKGKIDQELLSNMKIETFVSSKCELSFDEWQRMQKTNA